MPEEILLTKHGLEKIEKELTFLKSVKRKEVANRIKEAISYGDITDNSEYEDAKIEQAFIEGRIATLEKMLRHARVLNNKNSDGSTVTLGSTVRLKDLSSNNEYTFTIVSSAESDPGQNKISNASPVGKAIMGKKVGDEVEVKVPAGIMNYKIMDVC